jgi:hypothetical protein
MRISGRYIIRIDCFIIFPSKAESPDPGSGGPPERSERGRGPGRSLREVRRVRAYVFAYRRRRTIRWKGRGECNEKGRGEWGRTAKPSRFGVAQILLAQFLVNCSE